MVLGIENSLIVLVEEASYKGMGVFTLVVFRLD